MHRIEKASITRSQTQFAGAGLWRSGSGTTGYRDREDKCRAFADLAFHPDFASVGVDDMTSDGQAKPRPTVFLNPLLGTLVELREHSFEIRSGNTPAVVRHSDLDLFHLSRGRS